MREITERPEAIDAGTVKLVGTDYHLIVNSVSELLENHTLYLQMSQSTNPYGDGHACERIIENLY
jgi:UDP-N-acetylglucosamine 2-epimerase (non-hydrolysing)